MNEYTQINGISFYILNAVIILDFLVVAYFASKSKFRGSFVGTFVSKGTLTNPEIWKLTNKKRSMYIFLTNIPILIIDIALFLLKAPEFYANIIMATIVLLDFFVIDFIVAVYEEHLEKKFHTKETEKITPEIKKRTYVALIISAAIIITVIIIVHTLGFKAF